MIPICAFAAVIGAIYLEGDAGAARNPTKLSGRQIRARLAGMQVTDEVHHRFVYERDGTLRSYSMGSNKVGGWSVKGNELCLDLGEREDGCYSVLRAGDRIAMVPSGLTRSIDGMLQPADE
jgi:hypothetical protein